MRDLSNIGVIKDFIETHDLQDRFGNIQFRATVTISTLKREYAEEMTVRVELNGYDAGVISLIEPSLDALSYPVQLHANWQTFSHVNSKFLQVNGNHVKNPEIGVYEVKIYPIGRV